MLHNPIAQWVPFGVPGQHTPIREKLGSGCRAANEMAHVRLAKKPGLGEVGRTCPDFPGHTACDPHHELVMGDVLAVPAWHQDLVGHVESLNRAPITLGGCRWLGRAALVTVLVDDLDVHTSVMGSQKRIDDRLVAEFIGRDTKLLTSAGPVNERDGRFQESAG